MNEITIEISGGAGVGKSTLLNLIANDLSNIGFTVTLDPQAQTYIEGSVIDPFQLPRRLRELKETVNIIIKDSQTPRAKA